MFHDQQEMAKAMGVWFACFMGGMALGPVVGGFLLDSFWWGSAFLIAIPVMAVVLVIGPILLPEYKHTGQGGFGGLSVAAFLAGILPVIYGLKQLAENGFQVISVVAIVVGAVFSVLFVRRQQTAASPLVDLRLFGNRVFSASLCTMLIAGVVMAGITLLAALYLQSVKGLSPLHAGLLLVPQNVAMIVGSGMAPAFVRKFRPSGIMATGLAVSIAGLIVITQVGSTSGTWLLVTGLVFTTGGLALPMVLTSNLIVGSAPPEQAGAAAGMMETSGEFGVAIGIAAMGSLATFVYRSQLPSAIARVPAQATRTAHASLTAALSTAARLPGAAGADLASSARTAFSDSLNVVALAGGAVFLVLAVVVAITLRDAGVPEPQVPFTPGEAPAGQDTAPDAGRRR